MLARALAIAVLLGVGACGGGKPAPATQRLWVSSIPTNPKAPVTAFFTARRGDQYFGTFYHGSAYRGAHEAIRWEPRGDRQAVLHFLQDGKTHRVKVEGCTPDLGFHHCIRLVGGPYGVKKYQSRKRWAISGRAQDASAADRLQEILADDPDLKALSPAWP